MILFEILDRRFFTRYDHFAMEQHPIPQNITSFQFKLVGDMTLKQFLYLASGLTIAYIFFVFITPSSPILAWPVIIISSIVGTAFAFLPIADRPLDHWLIAFLKAVYSPTKRAWYKNNLPLSSYPQFINRFSIFKYQTYQQKITPTAAPQFFPPQPVPKPPPAYSIPIPEQPKPLPSQQELSKTVELAKQAQTLQVQIIETEKRLRQIKEDPDIASQASTENINQILGNLQKLMNDAGGIKRQLARITHQEESPKQTIQISIVPAQAQKQTQIILTTQPNVINGIIADQNKNYLDGVVVVIYDKGGLPVRALKTNKLGQFSGSTPLPSGTYTIQLEKDNFSFDVLQIELKGEILPPLGIIAKSHD